MTCGQATVLHLLNGIIEKTRLLASAFRNNQDQAMVNEKWVHALTLLFSLGPFSLCALAFRNNQHQAMAHDHSISQACTGIHLYKLIQLKNNP